MQRCVDIGRRSIIAKGTGFALVKAFALTLESPRRGETFVTRKITRAVATIKHGLQKELFLGNLDPKRDWGFAPEYIEGIWRILQVGEADDFVLATGESHTVREFVEAAFAHANLDWKQYVKHDPRYERPAEVDVLVGDASKARKTLGWEPKVRFYELVRIMVVRTWDCCRDRRRESISASSRSCLALASRIL